MRKVKTVFSVIFLLAVMNTNAQSNIEKQIAEKVEQLRKAMIDGDSAMLDKLAADNLMYRHSGGHIDDKKEFVGKFASGKSDFVTVDLEEQKIQVINKKTVAVYHNLNAKTNDGGKPGEVHLFVLLVWKKQGGSWKMVARQAAKKV
jgi:ketosteroid isomerase-like protein